MKDVFFMFYDIYCALCQKNGLTPSGAASKIGFNRASVTMWKNTGKAPKQELLLKIAEFFGVTTDYLLTGEDTKKAPTQEDERTISDKELMFALWGDSQNVDESDLEDVRRYAAFVEERKKKK